MFLLASLNVYFFSINKNPINVKGLIYLWNYIHLNVGKRNRKLCFFFLSFIYTQFHCLLLYVIIVGTLLVVTRTEGGGKCCFVSYTVSYTLCHLNIRVSCSSHWSTAFLSYLHAQSTRNTDLVFFYLFNATEWEWFAWSSLWWPTICGQSETECFFVIFFQLPSSSGYNPFIPW